MLVFQGVVVYFVVGRMFFHFRPTEHRHLSPFRQARRRESSLQEQAEELQQLDRTLLKSARVHRPYAFQPSDSSYTFYQENKHIL